MPEGILLLASDARVVAPVMKAGVPVVMVGHIVAGASGLSDISVDEDALGAMAAEHLASLGLRHFAFVAHGDWPFIQPRRNGFVKAVEAMGHGLVRELQGYLFEAALRPAFDADLRRMLCELPRPCGLLAANDELGVLVVETCLSLGLRVPEDVSVLGVDDDEMACELSEVPLSSVKQPLLAMGYEAARMLHRQMESPGSPAGSLQLLPSGVAVRASSDLFAQDDPDVAAALRLIKDHAAEPINVAWLVRHLPVSRRSLECKFKAAVGRTLLGQIHHVRFQRAKELLVDSDLSLEQVARRSGFTNGQWMSESFRRELDITPSRYRRQFRNES